MLNVTEAEARERNVSWQSAVDVLSPQLENNARERDALGGTPRRERDLLRESGLLGLTSPLALGGAGQTFGVALEVVRRLARVDPSIAHVFGFHHLMLATVELFGNQDQAAAAHAGAATRAQFWGNALNPKDPRTRLKRVGAAYQLDGTKSFCSGARDSDQLIVSAIDAETEKLTIFALPSTRDGITALDDWDAFGQRQTDSGTVEFRAVQVHDEEILREPGPLGSTRATLRPCLAQGILVHIYLGIAEGAFEIAQTRLSASDGKQARAHDPLLLLRAGELFVELEGARLLAQRARSQVDAALARGELITPEERGQCAVSIAVAKVAAARTGLQVAERLFDLLGARAATRREGLDRFWRNVRVHTLHDPVDEKLRELGEFSLHGKHPVPGFYA